MPIFQLTEDLVFPSPSYATPSGILAVGGDLSVERLKLAYASGIFPWYSDDEPVVWWSPDPRFVLFPEKLKVSKSMRSVIRSGRFRITFDRAFADVITACGKVSRMGQDGTWITDDMKAGYVALHELGFAHSVEAWQDGKLVGGLYGVSLGNMFFGESMFAHVSNASKAAFIHLVRTLEARGFSLIDCQTPTQHLASLGAESIPRDRFLKLLDESLATHETMVGSWKNL